MIRDHLEKIRYFAAVCDAGTFRGAALRLRLSQSSLTIAVKKLEEAVGDKLLVRSKRGVQTTGAGEMLLGFSRELTARVEDLEVRMRAPKDPMAGHVRIGAYDSIAIYWLPVLMRSLQKKFPRLELSISIGTSAALVEQVKLGELDLAIVVEPAEDSRLVATKLFDDVFSFFASPRILKSVNSEGTLALPIIAVPSARASKRETLNDYVSAKGLASGGIIAVESFEIAKSLASQEVGIAILPHRVAAAALKEKSLVQLASLPSAFGRHKITLIELQSNESRSQLRKALVAMMAGQAAT